MSSPVRPTPAGRWLVDRQLTIRDVALPSRWSSVARARDPVRGRRPVHVHRDHAVPTAATRRWDWNMGLPGGALLVGPTLRVDLEVQAILQVGS